MYVCEARRKCEARKVYGNREEEQRRKMMTSFIDIVRREVCLGREEEVGKS